MHLSVASLRQQDFFHSVAPWRRGWGKASALVQVQPHPRQEDKRACAVCHELFISKRWPLETVSQMLSDSVLSTMACSLLSTLTEKDSVARMLPCLD